MAALAAAWMLLQAVHELGHVVGAWATGGTVVRVVLHPLAISRTDVRPNPRPLVVVWTGPIIGVALPWAAAVASRWTRCRCRQFAEFFAGLALVANGAYIGAGSINGVGDAGEMLRHGSPRWLLVAFGLACVAAGLWVWHRLTGRLKED
jgi:hypothetical protein